MRSGAQIQAFTLARQGEHFYRAPLEDSLIQEPKRSTALDDFALNEALCLGARRLTINITTWWEFSVDGGDAHSSEQAVI